MIRIRIKIIHKKCCSRIDITPRIPVKMCKNVMHQKMLRQNGFLYLMSFILYRMFCSIHIVIPRTIYIERFICPRQREEWVLPIITSIIPLHIRLCITFRINTTPWHSITNKFWCFQNILDKMEIVSWSFYIKKLHMSHFTHINFQKEMYKISHSSICFSKITPFDSLRKQRRKSLVSKTIKINCMVLWHSICLFCTIYQKLTFRWNPKYRRIQILMEAPKSRTYHALRKLLMIHIFFYRHRFWIVSQLSKKVFHFIYRSYSPNNIQHSVCLRIFSSIHSSSRIMIDSITRFIFAV